VPAIFLPGNKHADAYYYQLHIHALHKMQLKFYCNRQFTKQPIG